MVEDFGRERENIYQILEIYQLIPNLSVIEPNVPQ